MLNRACTTGSSRRAWPRTSVHAKTNTQFELLVRVLRARGFAVTYVQNITDVDDKIIRRARELRIDPSDLASMHERAYLEDMRALCNDSVDVTRAPATTLTESSARSSACSRRARRHQGAPLDAQLVEIVHRLGGSRRTSLPRPSLCAIAHAPCRVRLTVTRRRGPRAGHRRRARTGGTPRRRDGRRPPPARRGWTPSPSPTPTAGKSNCPPMPCTS